MEMRNRSNPATTEDESESDSSEEETSAKRQWGHFEVSYLACFTHILLVIILSGLSFILSYYFTPCQKCGKRTENVNANDTFLKHRLPNSVIPVHYQLSIQPFLAEQWNFTFAGNVTIKVKCLNSTNEIVLNSRDLMISDKIKVVDSEKNGVVKVERVDFVVKKEFFVIKLKKSLEVNMEYNVTMSFNGTMRTDFWGIYRMSHKDEGVTRWIAMTQFQPAWARAAFPCFDEPALNATFQLTLVRLNSMATLSNTHLLNVAPRDDDNYWVDDEYEITLNMSTYIFTFAVLDGFQSAKSPDGKIRIWSRSSTLANVKYALSIAPKYLQFFEETFKITNPLNKIDIVSVMKLPLIGMENWGLITIREKILNIAENGSQLEKVTAASTLAHEFAHQWFGNLVTPEWWTEVWLSEGFSTFMEIEAIESVDPSLNPVQTNYMMITLPEVIIKEASESAVAVVPQLNGTTEVNKVFNDLAFTKHFLDFRKYGTFNSQDFWKMFESIPELENKTSTVKEMMSKWTEQPGIPVVKFVRDFPENGTLTISQERFLFQDKENVINKFLWTIPVTYTTSAELNWDPKVKIWLTENKESVSLKLENDTWIIGNLEASGFYICDYDEHNWKLIAEQLSSDHKKISPVNRANIVIGAFFLRSAKKISQELLVNITAYLKNEKDPGPMLVFMHILQHLDALFHEKEDRGILRKHFAKLEGKLYGHLIDKKIGTHEYFYSFLKWRIRSEIQSRP